MNTSTPRAAAPLYGKFRGTVTESADPLQLGRIKAIVPGVDGFIPGTWALPCLPMAGINAGLFVIPKPGSGVWIEFERGDPNYPVWTGGFWGSVAERPVMSNTVPPLIDGITLQTTLKNGITISDVPGPTGGILIQTTSGAMISVNDLGIIISNGKGASITMTAGPMVDFNLGALQVLF